METPDLGKREAKGKPPYVFKTLISPNECANLKEKYNFTDSTSALYAYFDTTLSQGEAVLLKNNARLRVKIKDKRCFLELKKKGDHECDLADEISQDDYQAMLLGDFPEGKVKNHLTKIGLLVPVRLVDIVNTIRSRAPFKGGVLVLDMTSCDSKVEYSLEFRSTETFSTDQVKSIKEELKIDPNQQPPKSKLERFWEDRN